MTFKGIIKASFVFCITAVIAIALCGCDDLGAYESTQEYYNSFGEVTLINGDTGETDEYSVAESFYNKESRENFMAGEDSAYTKKVEYGEYVYMAIPVQSTIDMDTLALFFQSQNDVTVYISVYISVFVSDEIPKQWKPISDNQINGDISGNALGEEAGDETQNTEKVYDDPDPKTSLGDVVVHLKNGKWSSFVLDNFKINGETQKSIQINKDQYILLQIRNNSGVREVKDGKLVDPKTGLELQKAEVRMTNLLIRALDVKSGEKAQGGE